MQYPPSKCMERCFCCHESGGHRRQQVLMVINSAKGMELFREHLRRQLRKFFHSL